MGLFLEGLILRGAYLRREICVSKLIGLALQLEVNLLFLLCFTLYLKVLFQVQAPGGLIFGGRFNRGFFGLPIWGFIFRVAYTWRSLFIFTVCVSWVGEHISLGICVCQVGVTRDKCFHCREHISLGICVSNCSLYVSDD